ncbi:PepSY domain-containing protein [Streptomyces smyrnaeus]|uniref:PepSY domain-containing protein n=1 Tax=Streptomyces smyrnaeus TaxID=1387713 RepID=UPI0036C6FD4F
MPNFRSCSLSFSALRCVPVGVATLLFGLGLLSACRASDSSLYAGPDEASVTPSRSFSTEVSASPTGLSLSLRNGLTALDTAEEAVQRGTAYHLARDDEGTPEWEIKVRSKSGSEWSVSVSDDGTKVTGEHEDKKPDDNADKLGSFRVTIQEAVRKAGTRHPEQRLHSAVTSKNTKGEDIWKVTVTEGTTAEAPRAQTLINAKTGKVTRGEAGEATPRA